MPEGNPNWSKARKPSATELNDRQRRFADRILAGDTATAAYFKAFPRCKSKSTAEQEGCKLLKNPKVAAFIQELREWDEDVMQSERIITKQELLEFLTKTIRTAAGAIDRDDPLCQSYKDTVGQYSSTHEIKLPDKLRAAERICKIMGWDSPDKVEDVTQHKPATEEELAVARETLKKWTTFCPRA